ncbi:MAG: hypothetical protein M2R45_00099 [Verrucomicrobia subdivision 3 bacterium]|nr:hypothetical protein [Limisphaerales bacterium]MCS1412442.1 hypothetical protein [Limisphaerales bacterium]
MPRHLASCFLLLVSLFLQAGCVSYQLGPSSGLEAGAQTIEIAPFPNQTEEPRLSPVVASAMRRQIQSDGTFQLDTRRKGDLKVTGQITEYLRVGVTFQPGDISTIRDFELRMTARVKVQNRRTGEVMLDRPVTGRTLIRAFNDLASAERQALPSLADDLAQNITDMIVDGAW